MWTLMRVEMKSREEALRTQAQSNVIRSGGVDFAAAERLETIHSAGKRACTQIDRLYERLDELAAFSADMVQKSAFVTELTREIRFVALNTALESTRLGRGR